MFQRFSDGFLNIKSQADSFNQCLRFDLFAKFLSDLRLYHSQALKYLNTQSGILPLSQASSLSVPPSTMSRLGTRNLLPSTTSVLNPSISSNPSCGSRWPTSFLATLHTCNPLTLCSGRFSYLVVWRRYRYQSRKTINQFR